MLRFIGIDLSEVVSVVVAWPPVADMAVAGATVDIGTVNTGG